MKFVFGKPTDEPFDRETEINILTSMILRNQPTAVIGVRRIGKTSIILKTIKNIERPKIYINAEEFVEGKSFDLISFLSYYSSLIIAEAIKFLEPKKKFSFVLKQRGEEAINTLRELLGYVKLSFNINLVSIELFINRKSGNSKDSIRELLNLPQEIAEKIGKDYLIVIDEFQFLKLAEQNLPGLFHLMRGKWQFHKNVEYVVSGSSIGMLERLFSSKNESFYQFFFPIYINPFSREVSLNFLKEGFKDEGISYEEDSLNYVIKELDGIPAWLNYFGLKSLECKVVNETCVKKVLNDMMVDPIITSIVRDEYNKLSKNAKKVIKFLAEKGGRGSLRGIPLGRSSINEGVRKLINDGYIRREERGVYSIIDPLIAKILRVI